MKRRMFTFGLAALAATPVLPAVPVAAPSAAVTQHFALAKLLARAHNHCSPEMLARHLKVSPTVAKQVQGLLLERGVITSPVAGVSMATNPMNTNCVPKEALKPTNISASAADVRDRVKRLMERYQETAEQISGHSTDTDPLSETAGDPDAAPPQDGPEAHAEESAPQEATRSGPFAT